MTSVSAAAAALGRPLVERDYRLMKMQSVYDELIDTELATQDVEMYGEKMGREAVGQ